MLKIITTPNPMLTKAVKPVKHFDDRLKKLVNNMTKTLIAQKDPEGVGLAAPQVDQDLALFIIRPTMRAAVEVFVNPRIIKYMTLNTKHETNSKTKGERKHIKLEGCLSIPRIWGPVKRADKLLLQYQDLAGKIHQDWVSGIKAVIIQHEMDHLNGVLFTQRVLEQKKSLFEEQDGELIKIKF